MQPKESTIAKINNVNILAIDNGEKRVAIKPICEALGVTMQGQLERIKTDPILGSTIKICFTVGADGKKREMQTIPFKFVFGWLFTIDSSKVKPEAKESVIKYQLECYNALYNHFTEAKFFIEHKEKLLHEKNLLFEQAKIDLNDKKDELIKLKNEIKSIQNLTIDDYKTEHLQYKLDFEENPL